MNNSINSLANQTNPPADSLYREKTPSASEQYKSDPNLERKEVGSQDENPDNLDENGSDDDEGNYTFIKYYI